MTTRVATLNFTTRAHTRENGNYIELPNTTTAMPIPSRKSTIILNPDKIAAAERWANEMAATLSHISH